MKKIILTSWYKWKLLREFSVGSAISLRDSVPTKVILSFVSCLKTKLKINFVMMAAKYPYKKINFPKRFKSLFYRRKKEGFNFNQKYIIAKESCVVKAQNCAMPFK